MAQELPVVVVIRLGLAVECALVKELELASEGEG